jgi:hypothetical protein
MQSLGGLDAMRNPIQAARQMAWMFTSRAGWWRQWYGTRYLNLNSARRRAACCGRGQTADLR